MGYPAGAATRGQTRCEIVRRRLIDTLVFADLDADAPGIAGVAAGMPSNFVEREALVDAFIVDAVMPGDAALLSIRALHIASMGAGIGAWPIVVSVWIVIFVARNGVPGGLLFVRGMRSTMIFNRGGICGAEAGAFAGAVAELDFAAFLVELRLGGMVGGIGWVC